MTQYKVKKWNVHKVAPVADYGTFTNLEDVKALVKGYKFDEDMKNMFGIIVYARKNSANYYTVEER